MKTETNKAIVRAYVDAFSRGDVDAVCECFAPEAKIHGVLDGTLKQARVAWTELISAFRTNLHLDAMCAEQDFVAVRYRESGRFISPFRGIEPTGLGYEVIAMHWFEIIDQKIIQRWGVRDTASISRQIGIPAQSLIPPNLEKTKRVRKALLSKTG